MRLAGQAKLGYYPVCEETLRFVAGGLTGGEGVSILDPCAGEGLALHFLGEALGVSPEKRWGVELDEGRAEKLAAKGGPAIWGSALSNVRINVGSFSLIWCNPPYDNEFGGGGRMEAQFLTTCVRWLATGGVFIMHAPTEQLKGWWMTNPFTKHLEDCALIRLPTGCSPYKECLLVGRRRKADAEWDSEVHWEADFGPWTLPPASPKRFEKTGLTEVETERALAASPLNKLWERESLSAAPLGRPILPLGKGHRALLLASGHLDGLVKPEGQPAHVVRGVAYKEKYLAKEETIENEDGSSTHVKVESERAVLEVRTLDSDGVIRTFK